MGKSHEGKYAWTVKIGEKGQFVIPKEARDIFGIHPGDTILVLADKKKTAPVTTQEVVKEKPVNKKEGKKDKENKKTEKKEKKTKKSSKK